MMSLNLVSFCLVLLTITKDAQSLKSENLVGGFPVPSDKFLYSVFIQIGTRSCGGAIIDRWFVISAAHCFFTDNGHFLTETPKIYLGALDINDENEIKEIVLASEVFVPGTYPRYSQNVFEGSDIALLKLISPLNDKYTSVKLEPLKYEESDGIFTGVFTAYGIREVPTFDEKNEPLYNKNSLKKHHFANAIIMHRRECHLYLPKLNPTQFCARIDQENTPAGTCCGDSGSPLANGRKLVGILSTSNDDCNEELYPGTYVDIRQFEYFITSIITRSYHEYMYYHAYKK